MLKGKLSMIEEWENVFSLLIVWLSIIYNKRIPDGIKPMYESILDKFFGFGFATDGYQTMDTL